MEAVNHSLEFLNTARKYIGLWQKISLTVVRIVMQGDLREPETAHFFDDGVHLLESRGILHKYEIIAARLILCKIGIRAAKMRFRNLSVRYLVENFTFYLSYARTWRGEYCRLGGILASLR